MVSAMRSLTAPFALLALCLLAPPAPLAAAEAAVAAPAGERLAAERLDADTPATTARGNPFVAPAEWTIGVAGDLTLLTAPEGDSRIVLVDVPESAAPDADAAVAAAWKAYRP